MWINSFIDKTIEVVQNDENRNLLAAVYTMEEIWASRNAVINNNPSQNVQRKAEVIKRKFHDFIRFTSSHEVVIIPTIPQVQEESRNNFIRINFDAAVRLDFVVAGVCARDQEGNLIALITAKLPISDPEIAEARAARIAVVEAVNRGWENIRLEGDALNVIDQITGRVKTCWKAKAIISDISSHLKAIKSWSAIKVSRKDNKSTHELAKWAAETSFFGNLPDGSVPQGVLNALRHAQAS